MSEYHKCHSVLTSVFLETAYAIGNILAEYPIPDEATWAVARSLDEIHEEACRWCRTGDSLPGENPEDREHPAIAHLLNMLRYRSVLFEEGSESDMEKV